MRAAMREGTSRSVGAASIVWATASAKGGPMTQAHELTIVGQPAPRVEGFEKVTGSAKYVADISAPGALAGKILRSPYAHARILRIDTARAPRRCPAYGPW